MKYSCLKFLHQYSPRHGFRIYLTFYMLVTFIITNSFKGNLLALLTSTTLPPKIHSFEGLSKWVISFQYSNFELHFDNKCVGISLQKEIPVATYSASNGYLILESQNPYLQIIAKRTYYHYNYTAAFIELENRNLVMCDGNTFLENVIRQRYTNQ